MPGAQSSTEAVLFDWCGTLVDYPTKEDRFGQVLEHLGRPTNQVEALAEAYRTAEKHPAAIEADKRCDLSAEDHAHTKRTICHIAGIDTELGDAIEASYSDLDTYPTHPEAVEVITRLDDQGIKIAIVSDFHVDLRPHFDALGILDRITGFAISYEVGVTKPHPRMFQAALDFVSVPPERCLMVGDNPHPDGGAAALGIPTLILPVRRKPRPPLLERVEALVLDNP
ncbi:MAG: HAD family hydrolase [Actinomycetia bacterium]|nr:HAD family hydrolase [Actinomycetes bacterium]